jgi:DNA-binding IclR family transcriptional regulator
MNSTDNTRQAAPTSVQPGTGAQAVDRAASLLVRVLSATEPLTFPELVSASGLPKSTVSRLLSSLERNRLIGRTPSGEIVAGDIVAAFARRHDGQDYLISKVRPTLERLAAATGETINLAVSAGSGVVQIDQVDSRYMLGAANWVNREVPFHASALGKVLLAHGTPLPVGRLVKLTERTRTTRPALDADLRRCLETGYAVADGELEPGLVAIAAPIVDADGIAVAAISVSGPSSRLTAHQIDRIGRTLADESVRLSATLYPTSPAGRTSRKAGAA